MAKQVCEDDVRVNSIEFGALNTLNISVFHHISLMVKVNPMEYPNNLPPTWPRVASGIEVKVGFCPLGGAMVVSINFSNLCTW